MQETNRPTEQELERQQRELQERDRKRKALAKRILSADGKEENEDND